MQEWNVTLIKRYKINATVAFQLVVLCSVLKRVVVTVAVVLH